MPGIKKIQIITKAGHEQARLLGEEIKQWMRQKNIACSLQPLEKGESLAVDFKDPEMVLVLGGDGTMLQAAGACLQHQVPMLGINFGEVGFLTELEPENWINGISAVLNGDYVLSSSIVLEYELIREKKRVSSHRVINDLVVSRGGPARLIKLNLYSGDKEILRFRADGVVVSTPVGSTAYAVAAGGALIKPELEVIEVCPVCPFLNRFRPLILPSNHPLSIQVESSEAAAHLTVDGQSGCALLPGDRIVITQSEKYLVFIKPKQDNYFFKLREKGYL